jgi:hypothetical protein
MRRIAAFALVLLFGSAASAGATGTVRIQHHDNTVHSYTNVRLALTRNELTVTSPDRISTIVVNRSTCIKVQQLIRCGAGGLSLMQDGRTHTIPVVRGTFYFNLTDEDQAFIHSSTKLAAHSVQFALHTKKGTFITGGGRLDLEPVR